MSKGEKPVKRGRGRPKGSGLAHDREKHVTAICEWLAQGKTLAEYCRQPDCPSYRLIYDWTAENADFASRIARAREIGEDVIAQDVLQIIDTPAELTGDETGVRRDSAHVAWLRNRAEYRLKLLAKWNPKKWGDKIQHSGDKENPIAVTEIKASEYKRLRQETLDDDDV